MPRKMTTTEKTPLEQGLATLNSRFASVRAHKGLVLAQEKRFAMQLVNNSKALQDAAPIAVADACLQAASMGLTLNPAAKMCYLIPRRARKKHRDENWNDYNRNVPVVVYASPSYIGLKTLKEEAGGVLWIESAVFHKNDIFKRRGPDEPILFDPAYGTNRGDKVGVFCQAKTPDGSFLKEIMEWDEVLRIKEMALKDKDSSLMWEQFEDEGARKTCLRRAVKHWPVGQKNDALHAAIEIMDRNEGVALEPDREEKQVVLISEGQITELHAILTDNGFPQEKADHQLNVLAKTFGEANINNLSAELFEDAKARLKHGLAERDKKRGGNNA